MSRRYIVSKDDIAKARDVPLLPWLEQHGYELKKDGQRYYRLRDHDSIVIDPIRNRWYWNSQGLTNANTVDWLVVYEHMALPDAVHELLHLSEPESHLKKPAPKPAAPAALKFPEAHTDCRRVFGYLVKTRCIDPELVRELICEHLIYEDLPHHNALFLRRDDAGEPKGFFARGTTTGSQFKQDPSGSDKRWTFLMTGADMSRLYVCEAAIDCISIETLRRRQRLPARQVPILSLAGNTTGALKWYLQDHAVQTIYVCSDNDAGGDAAFTAVKTLFSGKIIRCKPPDPHKDWNEVCQQSETPALPFYSIESM